MNFYIDIYTAARITELCVALLRLLLAAAIVTVAYYATPLAMLYGKPYAVFIVVFLVKLLLDILPDGV